MDIVHEPQKRRFVAALESGDAELHYTRSAGKLNITHTYVPPAARGRGVAALLTDKALGFAEQERLEVVAICAYAKRYLTRRQRTPT